MSNIANPTHPNLIKDSSYNLYSESYTKKFLEKDPFFQSTEHVSTDTQNISPPKGYGYTHTGELNKFLLPYLGNMKYLFNTKELNEVIQSRSATQQDNNEGGLWRLTTDYYLRINQYVPLPNEDDSALIPNSDEVFKISEEELKEEKKRREEEKKAQFDTLKIQQEEQINNLKKQHADALQSLQRQQWNEKIKISEKWDTEVKELKKRYSNEQTYLKNRLAQELADYEKLNFFQKVLSRLQGVSPDTLTDYYQTLIHASQGREYQELKTLDSNYHKKFHDNTPISKLQKEQQEELDTLNEQHQLKQKELEAQHGVEAERRKVQHEAEQSLIHRWINASKKEQKLSEINNLSS